VYPLLAFMAAYTLSSMIDMVCDLCAALLGDEDGGSTSISPSASSDPRAQSVPASDSAVAGKKKYERLRRILIGGCISVAFILCSTRSISNYTNYRGEGCEQLTLHHIV
jgi:hypothetical protein